MDKASESIINVSGNASEQKHPETVLIIYGLQCIIKVVPKSPGKGGMIQPEG